MTYRYIGTESMVGAEKLERLGQQIQLPEEDVRGHVLGGLPILPDDLFEAVGFTAEELKKYAKPGPRQSAPSEFQAKLKDALMALHDWRESLKEAK